MGKAITLKCHNQEVEMGIYLECLLAQDVTGVVLMGAISDTLFLWRWEHLHAIIHGD